MRRGQSVLASTDVDHSVASSVNSSVNSSVASRVDHRSDDHRVYPAIGWREWVHLEVLGSTLVKAKIDTGAATSCLHAQNLAIENEGGLTVARFEFPSATESRNHGVAIEAKTIVLPVLDFRRVKSSNGVAEVRPLVRSAVAIGPYRFDMDLTLTVREEMGYRMLVGRRAVKNRFVVDVGRSFLTGRPVPTGGMS